MSASFDIAVVGAGAAGIAAAVSAAREGCSTLLLDARPGPGGTGGYSGLTTLCGLHSDEGRFLNNGFVQEFAGMLGREDGTPEAVRMGRVFVQFYRPASFQKIAARLLGSEPLLTTRWNTPLQSVIVQHQQIQSINGVSVGAVIDCSGVAGVGQAAGEELIVTDETTQAPAVVFTLENVERDLDTPVAVAPVLLALVRGGFPPVSFLRCAADGAVTVKFPGAPEDVPRLIDFLRRQAPGFERCRTASQEFTRSERAGRMIVGEYMLTGDDVLGARKFPDAVARISWPIEQWSAGGRQKLRYLPPGEHYEIPARCLRAAKTKNLFMAGKSLSADVEAVASARVMGSCLATGAAAGVMAAAYVRTVKQR
jgi:hypothetical protein